MKKIYRNGQRFGNWILKDFLGGGGNGEVWKCENSNGEIKAIKILKKVKRKSYDRFVDEMTVIEQNSDIGGIIALVDKFLPNDLTEQTPYYVMELCESCESKLRSCSIEAKVDAVIQVAETLNNLHQRNIFHRDIKPANILYYNSKYYLADFGLVDYPNKKEISNRNEEIGAKWTMAPEMRRESSKADAAKADVYSLAKTLWIILTGNSKGFDGQYSPDSIVNLKKTFFREYTSPIDDLLLKSTDNDPKVRPSIEEFIESLLNWKKLSKNFHDRNQQQWFEIQAKLFPISKPSRVVWENVADIIKILKLVCSYENLNHLFFPNSGGLDLRNVRPAIEDGCIELDFQFVHIVKPKRLLFESFGYNSEWNYFRLEAEEILPHGDNVNKKIKEKIKVNILDEEEVEDEIEYAFEELSEASGEYYPYFSYEDRMYNKNDYYIPNSARHITRWLKGSFVIFGKRSVYNLNPSTYDGRHNVMSTDEFRAYIQENVNVRRQLDDGYIPQQKDQVTKKIESLNNFRIEECTVYRCGWCGNFVDVDGNELDNDSAGYYQSVLNKFGHGLVSLITGKCCSDRIAEFHSRQSDESSPKQQPLSHDLS